MFLTVSEIIWHALNRFLIFQINLIFAAFFYVFEMNWQMGKWTEMLLYGVKTHMLSFQ